MELHKYKNLLDQVSAINKRYEKINDLTGENFNVFRILKLESSEVRMHSAFIAELLNPKGNHGQKDIFLRLFINTFCFKNNSIDIPSCKVEIEKHTGFINRDTIEGGRIDIIITDKYKNHIIIENKIYTGDQENQLVRYYNYCNNADLIYLTLEGKTPSDTSKRLLEENVHYKCYSYKHDILKWLELCRKEVTVYPIIREGITHYINSIKYLTNQTLNQNMQEELSDLLKTNLEAAFSIYDNLDAACDKVSKDFGVIIKNECGKLGLTCDYLVNFNQRYNGIWVYKPEWKYFSICFQFQNYDKDLIYGFMQEDPAKNPVPVDVREPLVSAIGVGNSSSWWPWFDKMEEPYNNWEKFEAWQAIQNGTMIETMIEKIKHLLIISENLTL